MSAVPTRGYRVEVGRVAERAESVDDALSLALHLCQQSRAPIGTPVTVTHRAGTSSVIGVWDGDAIAWRDTARSHWGTGRPTGWVDALPTDADVYRSAIKRDRNTKGRTTRQVVRHGRVTVTTPDGVRMSEHEVDRWATDWARLACEACEQVRERCANGDKTRKAHQDAIDAGADWCQHCAIGCGCMPDPIGGTSVVWQQLIHSDRGIAATLLRDGIATGTPPHEPRRFSPRLAPDPVPMAGVARAAWEPERVGNVVRLFAPADRGLMFRGHGPAMRPPVAKWSRAERARVKRASRAASRAARERERAASVATTFSASELAAIREIAAVVTGTRGAEVGATLNGHRVTFRSDRGRIRWESVDTGASAAARSVDALVARLVAVCQ